MPCHHRLRERAKLKYHQQYYKPVCSSFEISRPDSLIVFWPIADIFLIVNKNTTYYHITVSSTGV